MRSVLGNKWFLLQSKSHKNSHIHLKMLFKNWTLNENSDLIITSVTAMPLLAEWLMLPRHMILIQNYRKNVLKIANQKSTEHKQPKPVQCWRSHTINRREDREKTTKMFSLTQTNVFFNTVREWVTACTVLWKVAVILHILKFWELFF